jgi:outer membrane protein
VAFLGDNILSAKNVSPTLLLNYHFGAPSDTWRPYVGAGINYTHFTNIESSLAPQVEMSDSWGWAVQAGVDYALNKQWGLWGSIAALKVKSDVVAVGATVLTTTIDFRPVTYAFGVFYKF